MQIRFLSVQTRIDELQLVADASQIVHLASTTSLVGICRPEYGCRRLRWSKPGQKEFWITEKGIGKDSVL